MTFSPYPVNPVDPIRVLRSVLFMSSVFNGSFIAVLSLGGNNLYHGVFSFPGKRLLKMTDRLPGLLTDKLVPDAADGFQVPGGRGIVPDFLPNS